MAQHRITPGNPPHGLLLGWRQDKEPVSIWDNRNEGHLITVAPTGAGKGVSSVIPALLSWQGPAIVIDPRGENYAVTADRRRLMGQQVRLLDPFGVTSAPVTDALNPLDILDICDDAFEDDALAIANMLIHPGSLRSTTDPFWLERASALLATIITQLVARNPVGCEVTLGQVAAALRCEDATLEMMLSNIGTKAKSTLTLSSNEFGTSRTRAAIFASAASHVGFLRSFAVEAALSKSTISLDDIGAGLPMTIYFAIPQDKLATHAPLLRLWLGVMLMTLGRRRSQPKLPTLFLIDEAAQLGELEQLRTALTLMRGFGVRVWLFFQDMTQLSRIYSDWESILNNCTTQQFFKPATPFARRMLDEYLQGAAPFEAFKDDKAVLVSQGATHMVTRPDYRRDRIFAGLAKPNPFYPLRNGNVHPFPSR